jgi:polyvinyl alcohol dehydrogenase (cytochrome)
MFRLSGILCFLAVSAIAQTTPAQTAPATPDGKAVFAANCAMCHGPGGDSRAPSQEILRQRPNESIVVALEAGAMRSQGALLTSAGRRAVADFLSPRTAASETPVRENSCPANARRLSNLNGWNGWGVDLVNTRLQPTAAAGLRAEDVPKLKVKWAFGIPYEVTVEAQPTVVGGRLFFGSATGAVYSLDARTGCQYWKFQSDTRMRTAINVAPIGGGQYAAYFGDSETNVYAVNALTGKLLWKTRLDMHPMAGITGTPKLYKGRLYVGVRSASEEVAAGDPKYPCCTFRGSMDALDAATGKIAWKTFTIPDPPKSTKVNSVGTQMYGPSGVGIWSSPTIDVKRSLIYAGTGNNYSDPPTSTSDAILAFDLESGSMKWSKQLTEDAWNASCGRPGKPSCPVNPDRDVDIASSPILKTVGGKDMLLVGQKSGVVFALDPDRRGDIIWQKTISKGGGIGGIQWGIAADDSQVYAPISDIIPGPGGGLFALKIANGEQAWYVPPSEPACKGKRGCSPAQLAAATLIPGVVFSGSMDGHLRAHSTKDGSLIWDLDTVRDFDTVNGVKAHGGSLNVSGPAIADGMLFVNSGYNVMIGMPGNVLLALSVDGK